MRESVLPDSAPSSLAGHYAGVRQRSEALVEPLTAEDCQLQSMEEASPAKWHLAHTSWFFESLVLAAFAPGYKPFHPDYGFLFNSYYDGLGPRHPRARRGLLARPTLDEIFAYRAHVDRAMAELWEAPEAAGQILLGIHHEQQHQELILTDIKHAFFANPLLPAYVPAYLQAVPAPAARAWLSHPGGVVEIGEDGDGFAFDNERPRHAVLLRPFRIASRAVTNAEFSAFIEDGGYRRAELWLSDGWALVEAEGWDSPLYWLGGEQAFTLAGSRARVADAPVEHVSFFEAAAFAQWAGKRLPTEFEWEAAAAAGRDKFSSGEVWEWTRSSYDPYPGYRPFEGAAGEYNGKFMSGQMVLRGGSHATPAGHMRSTYRNFFNPRARWQFSGLRLAEDA